MRKLFDVCRRLEAHWAGDVIGVLLLMSLVPLVLFIGSVLDRGL